MIKFASLATMLAAGRVSKLALAEPIRLTLPPATSGRALIYPAWLKPLADTGNSCASRQHGIDVYLGRAQEKRCASQPRFDLPDAQRAVIRKAQRCGT
jgi:hypothetical protein